LFGGVVFSIIAVEVLDIKQPVDKTGNESFFDTPLPWQTFLLPYSLFFSLPGGNRLEALQFLFAH